MSGKVYIETVDGGVRFAETDEKGRLIRYLDLSEDLPVGNIYRGKVERVTGAGAFVNIGRELHGFLSGSDKKSGDFVTVSVARKEEGKKGCLLTEKLSLSGKYAVVTTGSETRFSRKTLLSAEKKKEIAEKVGEGVIFRTAFTESVINEALEEIAFLRAELKKTEEKAQNLFDIKLLYKCDVAKTAENMSDKERGEFSEIAEQIKELNAGKIVCGGVELVFDKTEAMTVIDVNSHFNTEKYSDEDSYAYATDLIAIEEVCRQIRLRNIGGIIAVDFVSVKDKEKIEKLRQKLKTTLKNDDVMAKSEFSDDFCVALISRTKRY